jgi:hypothetical protein
MQEVQMIEDQVDSRPTLFEYELADQARVAIERIRFAIKQTEQFCPRSEPVRRAGLQLLTRWKDWKPSIADSSNVRA